MPHILCYTKRGNGTYPDHNYPGHVAYNCDIDHAVHLAISHDGTHYKPLRNNTGVLYAKCSFSEGYPCGVTKTLIDPWLFRFADGSFGLCAIRQNQNAPDPLSTGCIMLFSSNDLVRYDEIGFLKVSDGLIRHPRCCYCNDEKAYRLYWETSDKDGYTSYTKDFKSIQALQPCEIQSASTDEYGIDDCIPGNVLAISESEASLVQSYLDEIRNVSVAPITHTIGAGTQAPHLPKALCLYSDGSTHLKSVDWDMSPIDLSKPGIYQVQGKIKVNSWPFPLALHFGSYHSSEISDPNMHFGMSDPCVTFYKGKYYLSSTGNQNIVLRCADTIAGVFSAAPVIIHRIPLQSGQTAHSTWAAELHEINNVLYMFTSLCPNAEWTQVKSVVLKCNGNPLDETAWEAPRYCVKPNGQLLTEGGISLDMTWFFDNGKDYVMWSDRKIQYDKNPLVIEPADIYIATINPDAPWQLTSDPVCLLRPTYGWDRCETEVDEAPYLLRHDNDLFVTISGSSTGMSDLYNIGLLKTKTGRHLLDPSAWDFLPYPLLTKESVPGQYGPGHNVFVKDPHTGDDWMVYHAVAHDENDRSLNRHPAMRRVHWGVCGLPYLEMTPERDLNPACEHITMELTITP